VKLRRISTSRPILKGSAGIPGRFNQLNLFLKWETPTPFIEYQRIENSVLSTRSARGYSPSIDIVDRFEEIRRDAVRLGITDPLLKKDVLCIGPCPGLWKTYYASRLSSETGRKVETLNISQYLGMQMPSGVTRKDLGEKFESWVKNANQSYNQFIESGDISDLSQVPGILGDYYTKMADLHLTSASASERAKTVIEIDGIPVPQGILLYSLTPDGVFKRGSRGAIFESKLSRPTHLEFMNDVATYAIALEATIKKDVDCAIVLYTDFPAGKHVTPEIFAIHDSHVSDVSRNIERFYRLIQLSETQRKEALGIGSRIKQAIRGPPKKWRDFLVRPDGLPDKEKRTYCPHCRYREACYSDGGEPGGHGGGK